MTLRTRIFSAGAMLSIAFAATTASAQITYVSQDRSVAAQASCGSQTLIAQNFAAFNQTAGPFVCGSNVARATQNSTLSSGAISLSHDASSGPVGVASASSNFNVVFDLPVTVSYTLSASFDASFGGAGTLVGPGTSITFGQGGVTSSSGTLAAGRYTIQSRVNSPGRDRPSLTVNLDVAPVPFTIPWATQDCGGGDLSGGAFDLLGTIGQPDAALPVLTGGGFRITLGYWARDPGSVPCVADYDDGTGTGQPDGGVTIDDLLFYLEIFRSGSASADVDDGTFTGIPDGGVTIDDLLYYLLRFADGC